MTTLLAVFCSLSAGDFSQPDVVLDRPVPRFLTGTAFQRELSRPLTASWKNVPLRSVLRRLSEIRKISVVLDRRIDPTQQVAVELNGQSLLFGLGKIAEESNAWVSVVGNTVCIGPRMSLSRLRTLVALRSNELPRLASRLPKERLRQLSRRQTLHWNDLDRPADILQKLAAHYHLKIDGLDRIPHDLWAEATFPSANAVEALSLVLIQFGLTFHWSIDAAGVQIVPVPDNVSIERSYRPRGSTAELAAKEWTAKFSGLRAEAKGNRVLVAGTIEQHETIAALLRPGSRRPSDSPKPTPLNRRIYADLKIKGQPALALIQKLEKTGIVFKYDAKKLAAAGVDLNTKISMDLKNPTADDVLEALCKPLGLKFSTAGLTVTLSPN